MPVSVEGGGREGEWVGEGRGGVEGGSILKH